MKTMPPSRLVVIDLRRLFTTRRCFNTHLMYGTFIQFGSSAYTHSVTETRRFSGHSSERNSTMSEGVDNKGFNDVAKGR